MLKIKKKKELRREKSCIAGCVGEKNMHQEGETRKITLYEFGKKE